ncbi:MauE/DoxX family redox-associated membrane protein, partial [Flavobacterium sp.]
MSLSKKNTAWGIRILISFLFLLSAVAKLYPSPYFAISTFEVKQLYPMGFSEGFAPYFSRILIGIEFALGLLILQKNFLRSIVIPGTILLLAVFTTHLTIVTIQDGGNSGNCGCFGSLLPMTPVQAIAKNVVAMILLVWLFIIMPKTNERKDNFWVLTSVTFAMILMLFMLAPIQPPASNFTVSAPEETS